MKKLLIIFLLCSFVINANAQQIKIKKLKKIAVQEKAYFPSFGKSKHEILFTGANYKGLALYNTRTRKTTRISDEQNAGSTRIIEKDNIIFKQDVFLQGKKTSQYKSFDYSNKQVSEIKEIPSAVNQQKVKPVATVKGKQIIIQFNSEETKNLSPLGDCYYLWASVSPDGSKILFTATTHGTYVTDLKGNILHELKNLNDPSWINDNWVAGMNDIDNGETIISSEIIAVYLPDNDRFILTEKNKNIAMYPKFSPEGDRFVFNTPDGSVYTAKVRIK